MCFCPVRAFQLSMRERCPARRLAMFELQLVRASLRAGVRVVQQIRRARHGRRVSAITQALSGGFGVTT